MRLILAIFFISVVIASLPWLTVSRTVLPLWLASVLERAHLIIVEILRPLPQWIAPRLISPRPPERVRQSWRELRVLFRRRVPLTLRRSEQMLSNSVVAIIKGLSILLIISISFSIVKISSRIAILVPLIVIAGVLLLVKLILVILLNSILISRLHCRALIGASLLLLIFIERLTATPLLSQWLILRRLFILSLLI